MKILSFLLLIVISAAMSDAVWEYPFDELEPQWTYGSNWSSGSTGPTFLNTLSGYDGDMDATYQTTVLLAFPEGCDSITVDMDIFWEHTGYTMDGGVSIATMVQADPFTGDLGLYYASDDQASWEYSSFYTSDSDSASGTIDLDPSLEGRIIFRAQMSGYGYIWSTQLDWEVSELTITGHGVTALERNSWAAIKSLF